MKKIFFTIIFYLFCTNISAQNVMKTLSDAFKNNSKLNAERASLNATKQDVNISRGEFLPSVTISGNISSQEDTNRTNKSGEKLTFVPGLRLEYFDQRIDYDVINVIATDPGFREADELFILPSLNIKYAFIQ